MHIFVDFITVAWMIVLLFLFAWSALEKKTIHGWVGLAAISAYLLAQSSWTVAWMLGDEWGRDFANYLWFTFNTSVCLYLTISRKGEGND